MGKLSRRRSNTTMRSFTSSSSSSSSATAAVAAASILLIASSGPLSPPLLVPGAHALGSAFSCGSSLHEARSCTTLCSTTSVDGAGGGSNKGNDHNGAGTSSCPSGQKCYAGIECEPSKSMDWILDWQDRLERRMVEVEGAGGERSSDSDKMISSPSSSTAKIRIHPRQPKTSSFVCGRTYNDVEARCKRAMSATAAVPPSSTSSEDIYHGVNYCPTGSSSECPASMECYYYASMPCSSLSSPPPPHEIGLLAQGGVAEQQVAVLELRGLPPLVSPSSNILSRLDVDSLTRALLNNNNNNTDTSINIASSNANMTEEINNGNVEEENVQVHLRFGSSSSLSSSWGAFFRESFSGMMMKLSMPTFSSTIPSSPSSSAPHSLLRYSSSARHDWN